MQMPILAVHAMAMNESVAATCCYRQVVSSSNYYTEVLSGGVIESGPQNMAIWKEGVPQEWAWLDFDVDFSAYTGNTPVPYYNNLLKKWWVLYFNQSTIVYASPIEELLNDPAIPISVKNQGCTHSDKTCLYITYKQENGSLHVGATQAHEKGGAGFAQTHTAMQFSS